MNVPIGDFLSDVLMKSKKVLGDANSKLNIERQSQQTRAMELVKSSEQLLLEVR